MFRLLIAAGTFISTVWSTAAPPPKELIVVREWREDGLPKGASARLGSLTFNAGLSYALSFSPDGRTVLAPANNQLFAWDVATGRELKPKSIGPVGSKSSSPGYAVAGDRLFTLEFADRTFGQRERPGTITVTELSSGKRISQVPVAGPMLFFEGYSSPPHLPSIAVARDGKYLAAVSEARRAVEVYAANSGAHLHSCKLENTYLAGLTFSPDSKTLYIYDPRKTIRRFDPIGGTILPGLAGTDTYETIRHVDVSPDGKWVVTQGTSVEKDEAGRSVAVVGNTYLLVHDATANKAIGKLETGASLSTYKFVGPDAVVIAATKVRPPGPFIQTLSRWNVVTRKREWEVPVANGHRIVASPDGRWVAVGSFIGMFDLYDAATGKREVVRTGHDGVVSWVGFSADGKRVTTVGGTQLITWSLTGDRLAKVEPPEVRDGRVQPPLLGDRLVWVAFGPDGKTADLVAWDMDMRAVAWKLPVGTAVPERVYSHDGKRVVGIRWDEGKRVWTATVYDGPAGKVTGTWDVTDGDWTKTNGKGGSPWSPPLALSGDGKTLVAGFDAVACFGVETGKVFTRVKTGLIEPVHGRMMFPLSVSADGSRIIVIGKQDNPNDGTICVFDVASGTKLLDRNDGNLYAPAAKFSPDGKRVAVWIAGDNAVRLYDIRSAAEPRLFEGSSRPTCVAFSPDGKTLVSGHNDGTALVWNLDTK